MGQINLLEFLSYGAVGLGLALAVLAYFLLKNEQKNKNIRIRMLTSIYAFMGFSIILTFMGFASEYLKDSKFEDIEDKLLVAVKVLDALMQQKEGKVARLETLDPSDPAYFALVNEIQNDLASIDQQLKKAIEGLAANS